MSSAEKPAPGEQDYKYANELRDLIHEKVLEKARLTDPGIDTVVDPYPVDAFFQWNWEYPGAWYLIVAIPEGFKSRDAFIDFLVQKTLEQHKKTKRAVDISNDSYFRVISNQVRFGYGFRTVDGQRVYFAWHGYPNRNDDYFTTSEISESEFDEIGRDYPEEISADRETAEVFRNKYVDHHPVLLEGWNRLL